MRPARHHSAYRVLLRLYPRSFRDEYGADMTQLFGDRLRDRGRRAWIEAGPDLVRTVPVLRMEAAMTGLSTGARVVALAVIVLGAVAVSVGFGAGAAPLLIVIAAVAGTVALTRERWVLAAAFGVRAPLWRSVTQAWWAPLAAVLGVAMLVFGVGTVFEAHNWGGRVFGSAVMLAFAATMLLGLMRRPFDRVAGNSMILLATVPAFPLFWLVVPAAVALVIWIGVLASGFGDDLRAEPLPGHQ
jgi:hypothetical protein